MPSKKIISLAIALGVGIVGIIIIGLLHKEAQKDEDVWAVGKRAVQWDKPRIPLHVCTLGDLEGYGRSLDSAVGTFNSYARFKILTRTEKDCDILVQLGGIEIGETDREDAFGSADVKPDGGLGQTCVVTLHDRGNIRFVMFVFMHEFTHCLGLVHDGFTASLTHIDAPKYADAPRPPMLTDKDVDALKERYK